MQLINETQCSLLEAVNRFTFLSVSHFEILTGKSKSYLRAMLAELTSAGYLKSYRIEVSYQVRAENTYYLHQKGADFLRTHKHAFVDHVNTGTVVIVRDHFHRHRYISLLIAITMFADTQGISLELCSSYFTKSGSTKQGNLQAVTYIPLEGKGYYVPDGVIRTAQSLHLLELYNDKDIKRITASIATHAKAIALGTPGKTFNVPANPKVIACFTHADFMERIIQKLQKTEGFFPMQHLFYFGALTDAQQHFASAFSTIANQPLQFM